MVIDRYGNKNKKKSYETKSNLVFPSPKTRFSRTRIVIIGSTSYENLQTTYKKNKVKMFGFRLPVYKIYSELTPKDNVIYEINDLGINEICKFKMKRTVTVTKTTIENTSYYGYDADYPIKKIKVKNKNRTIRDLEDSLRIITGDKQLSIERIAKKKYMVFITDNLIRENLIDQTGFDFENFSFTYKQILEMVEVLEEENTFDYKPTIWDKA